MHHKPVSRPNMAQRIQQDPHILAHNNSNSTIQDIFKRILFIGEQMKPYSSHSNAIGTTQNPHTHAMNVAQGSHWSSQGTQGKAFFTMSSAAGVFCLPCFNRCSPLTGPRCSRISSTTASATGRQPATAASPLNHDGMERGVSHDY
jgi:hypothetical protein